MHLKDQVAILSAFADLPDPRGGRHRLHPLQEVLLVALAGMASGAEDWVSVSEWGEVRLAWLRQFLPFKRGIASHDTFRRVFALLDASQFEALFMAWMSGLCPSLADQTIAIDGKSLRGSRSAKGLTHLVSACHTDSGLTLAQGRTADKSNEITAVPALLEALDIRGATVTIDAMGCQRLIANKIVERGAHYILSTKNNQPKLAQATQTGFDHSVRDVAQGLLQQHITLDKDHARLETRRCVISRDLAHFDPELRHQWPGLQTTIMVESTREILGGTHQGRITTERRYYISSAAFDAAEFNRRIRAHWRIENRCHWLLDVVFGEDDCRLHTGHGAQNFAILRRIVLNLLKNEKSTKASVKLKWLRLGWSVDYLQSLLGLSPR